MKLFVYGTLIPNILKGHRQVAILNDYQRYYYGFATDDITALPFLLPNKGKNVVGFLVEIDNIEALDKYEGVDVGLYKRERSTVYPVDGQPVEADFYVLGDLRQGLREMTNLDPYDSFRMHVSFFLISTYNGDFSMIIQDKIFTYNELQLLLC